MGRRWGPGPVFRYEWRLVSRRWQFYVLRVLFVGLVAAGLCVVWATRVRSASLGIRQLAAVGEAFFYALVGTQLALVLLVAPAYTAGAVCQDKVRGPLLHLFVTDLSDAEIVLGKLAARLLPVLGLVLVTAPVLFAAILLGGIAPEAALGALLVTLGVAVLGCAGALALSVWGRKTHEVLVAAYLVGTVLILPGVTWALLARPRVVPAAPAWVEWTNPFTLAFLPYLRPGVAALPGQAVFLAVALAASAALTVLAVRRVRAVTLRHEAAPARGRLGTALRALRAVEAPWMPSPPLDANPVLWREWYHRRPSRSGAVVWGAYAVLAALGSLLAIEYAQTNLGAARSVPGHLPAAFVNGFQVSIGLLLLSVGSVTGLAEERARGSLDLLLATPLTASTIVWGKWWGSYRRVPLLALGPVLVAGGGRP